MDFIKYDMTDLWASAGDVVAPDPTKVRAGWGVEVVPRQWWNWFENRQDNNLAYMLQKGIPEWDATTQYIINKSYVQRNGIVYKATATSTNSDPVALTSWIKAFSDSTPFLEAMKGLGVTNSSVPVFNSTGIAAFLSYGATGASVLATNTPAAARTVIDAQQSSSNLTALAGVAANTNKLPYFNGTTTATVTDLTDFGRSLLDDVDAAAARTTLGVDSAANTTAALNAGLATKQPLSISLTALAATTPAINTLPYYTGSTTAATTPLTDFGRTLLSSADATAGRTALGVDSSVTSAANLATRQPLNTNLTAFSGLTGSADRLPYFTGASSLSLATLTTFGRTLIAGNDATAVRSSLSAASSGANTDITSLSGLSTALSVIQGGTGVTSLPVPFTRMRDSQALTYTEAASERYRMKTFEPINFVTDIDDTSAAQIRGPGYVNNTTVGTKPGGYVYGVVNTILITADTLCQTFDPLTGTAGVTYPQFRRTGYGSAAGKWGPWLMVMDERSAILDPSNSPGGINSRTIVSGVVVNKFISGLLISNGAFGVTASCPANMTSTVSVTLPANTGADTTYTTVAISLIPTSANDFALVTSYMSSPTVLTMVIKNGATAQTFSPKGIITGHWK